jgi:hypothetical protein
MKKIFTLVFVLSLLFSLSANAQLLLEENFDYGISDTSDITAVTSNWVRHSGTQGPAYNSAGLSFTGYLSSNIGGALSFTNGSSGVNDGDVNQVFSDSVSIDDTIFVGFLVELASAKTGDYFLHLGPRTIGTTFRLRVFAKDTTAGGWLIGLSKSSTGTIYDTTVLAYNKTYLVTGVYVFKTGATDDDEVALSVFDNDAPQGMDFPILVIGPLGTGVTSDPASIGSIAVRQGTNTPTGKIDGIRVSTSWSDVVPVELVSFNASSNGTEVNLSWMTATELNNSGFSVERKTGSSNWQSIGFVKGNGTTTAANNYTFTDKNILSQTVYLYRLKQIDFDGSFSYSKVVQVSTNSISTFELKQNYPNPFNPSTQISFSLAQNGFVKLVVYNLLGQEVKTLINRNMEAGSHSITFDASGLQSGVYIYKLTSSGLTLTKKMVLLR